MLNRRVEYTKTFCPSNFCRGLMINVCRNVMKMPNYVEPMEVSVFFSFVDVNVNSQNHIGIFLSQCIADQRRLAECMRSALVEVLLKKGVWSIFLSRQLNHNPIKTLYKPNKTLCIIVLKCYSNCCAIQCGHRGLENLGNSWNLKTKPGILDVLLKSWKMELKVVGSWYFEYWIFPH